MPALAELDAVRAVVSRRALLPAPLARSLHRVLFEVDPVARLGAPPAASDAELVELTLEQLGEWRSLQDVGRVPFGSRDAVEAVVRCLERQWAGLAGYRG